MPRLSEKAASTQTAAQVRRLSTPHVNAQSGTTYTLTNTDHGGVVSLTNTNPITVTVPSGLATDFACVIIQSGSGQVTVAASGSAVNAYSAWTKLAGQHAAATLIQTAADVYNLSGNLTA